MIQVRMPRGTLLGGPPEVMRRMLAQGGRVASPVSRSPKKVPADRKVRVLAVVHGWFPHLAAGSERMLQHMLDALPRDEFEVRILSFGVGDPVTRESEYVYEGTSVTRGYDPPRGYRPDLIITHHGIAARVVPSISEQYPEAAIVAVYHNERYDIPDIQALQPDLNVYNTKWVKKALGTNGIVVHPPLEPERHRVEKIGNAVTLVNLQENKGVDVFYELARRSLHHDFLGVIGTHGEQKTGPLNWNTQVWESTQDMRQVWRRTKVVLMPSGYESYGMVAAEACINGIPVIAHPTPGLVECLDDAGLFVPRDDVDGWERVLNQLLTDDLFYQEWSDSAYIRGCELASQTQRELSRFVRSITKLVRA